MGNVHILIGIGYKKISTNHHLGMFLAFVLHHFLDHPHGGPNSDNNKAAAPAACAAARTVEVETWTSARSEPCSERAAPGSDTWVTRLYSIPTTDLYFLEGQTLQNTQNRGFLFGF